MGGFYLFDRVLEAWFEPAQFLYCLDTAACYHNLLRHFSHPDKLRLSLFGYVSVSLSNWNQCDPVSKQEPTAKKGKWSSSRHRDRRKQSNPMYRVQGACRGTYDKA